VSGVGVGTLTTVAKVSAVADGLFGSVAEGNGFGGFHRPLGGHKARLWYGTLAEENGDQQERKEITQGEIL